ncbi:MAG: EutN/CcmL family microcompartment protein [Lentimicrobium sp.]|nr:EutN/CcmL family microcompartment protein [Lentimicrobium sp.]
MILGKVVGSVVSNTRSLDIDGAPFLLVEKTNQKGEKTGEFLIAVDIIGAGYDEMVMVSESTSARETLLTTNKPLDALIVGIIDRISEDDKFVYIK